MENFGSIFIIKNSKSAYKKDHFLLSFINIILDDVISYKLNIFIDRYLSNNEIFIVPKDYHKYAFIAL